jgi:hypothetical protein
VLDAGRVVERGVVVVGEDVRGMVSVGRAVVRRAVDMGVAGWACDTELLTIRDLLVTKIEGAKPFKHLDSESLYTREQDQLGYKKWKRWKTNGMEDNEMESAHLSPTRLGPIYPTSGTRTQGFSGPDKLSKNTP